MICTLQLSVRQQWRTAAYNSVFSQEEAINLRVKFTKKVTFLGGLAQLVERLLCKQNVIGSTPVTSTKFPKY